LARGDRHCGLGGRAWWIMPATSLFTFWSLVSCVNWNYMTWQASFVRLYMAEASASDAAAGYLSIQELNAAAAEVGRCRLTVSQPELKARLLSALETKV